MSRNSWDFFPNWVVCNLETHQNTHTHTHTSFTTRLRPPTAMGWQVLHCEVDMLPFLCAGTIKFHRTVHDLSSDGMLKIDGSLFLFPPEQKVAVGQKNVPKLEPW